MMTWSVWSTTDSHLWGSSFKCHPRDQLPWGIHGVSQFHHYLKSSYDKCCTVCATQLL